MHRVNVLHGAISLGAGSWKPTDVAFAFGKMIGEAVAKNVELHTCTKRERERAMYRLPINTVCPVTD